MTRAATATGRSGGLPRAAGLGALAGLVGVAVMTAAEKVEQSLTHRPNSYVPGRTLLRMMGRPGSDDSRPVLWNHAMHWGTGAVVGALRGVWAAVGLRGPRADLAHTVVRLAFDQTAENVTGAGAPPHTWPVKEQAVDVLATGLYSFVTGTVADHLIDARQGTRQGRTSH
jgi:hypothetical protein